MKAALIVVLATLLHGTTIEAADNLYDDITNRIERDLRPGSEAIRYMLDLIVLDHPQAQRVSEKDYWDLTLLDEIRRSGFINQLPKGN